MRDPEYVAALFESILEEVSFLCECSFKTEFANKHYSVVRKRLIDLMVEIELGNTPDWDQINSILPTMEKFRW